MGSILIIGHGSRVEKVNRSFEKFIDIIKDGTKKDVWGANLTLAPPSVETTVKRMVEAGIKEIKVIPYFLSDGTHVIKNIPQLLDKLEKIYPGLRFTQDSSLLLNPLIIQAVINKIED